MKKSFIVDYCKILLLSKFDKFWGEFYSQDVVCIGWGEKLKKAYIIMYFLSSEVSLYYSACAKKLSNKFDGGRTT